MIKFRPFRTRLVTIILLAVTLFGAWWLLRCYGPNSVSYDIGEFESKECGFRAAIPHLVNALRFCPCSEQYRIIWKGPDPDNDNQIANRALFYNRQSKWLGYEHDPFSGTAGKAYTVDEAAIRAVAKKGGSLEDFSEYDPGQE